MQIKELQEQLNTSFNNAYTINQILNNKRIVIVDHEKRKIIDRTQTFSLDSDYISHIEEFITYEYYLEYAANKKSNYIAFKFDDINSLNVLDKLIKNKKEGK
jgi:hypothetical protein